MYFLYQDLSIGLEYLFLLSSRYGKKSFRKFLYMESLEVVHAISHTYVILPKLFPHYLSLILIFRFDKDNGVGVTVGQYL